MSILFKKNNFTLDFFILKGNINIKKICLKYLKFIFEWRGKHGHRYIK